MEMSCGRAGLEELWERVEKSKAQVRRPSPRDARGRRRNRHRHPPRLANFSRPQCAIRAYNSGNFPRPAEEAREDEMQKQRNREISWTAVAVLALVAFEATLGGLATGQSESKAQTPSTEKAPTKVVLLGTGTPRPY